MRDMPQLSIRFFKFDGPLLELLDQLSNALVVWFRSSLVAYDINHSFLSL